MKMNRPDSSATISKQDQARPGAYATAKNLRSDPVLRRRTHRILARVPVSVHAQREGAEAVEEQTFALVVHARGGLLLLRMKVHPGQCLQLQHGRSREQKDCVVAYLEPADNGYAHVSVQFVEPHPEFWHATFPPEDWTWRHPDAKSTERAQAAVTSRPATRPALAHI